ncbi:MAG TPA: heavy metal-associated domain-containing protein [Pseudonocardia sp.]|jgi:copper chaperone CopZ|nr:heavy metal-associated domain-containing protein [Pseudonocardia sp.]
MFTEAIVVSGMHCRHCVATVTEEIQERLPAIGSVEVDLATGRTEVSSEHPIDPRAVRDAVELAGFRTLEPAAG